MPELVAVPEPLVVVTGRRQRAFPVSVTAQARGPEATRGGPESPKGGVAGGDGWRRGPRTSVS